MTEDLTLWWCSRKFMRTSGFKFISLGLVTTTATQSSKRRLIVYANRGDTEVLRRDGAGFAGTGTPAALPDHLPPSRFRNLLAV